MVSAEFHDLVLVHLVHGESLLEEDVELVVPSEVTLRVLVGLLFDKFQDSSGENLLEFGDEGGVLVVLTGDVEGDILTVDGSLDESQVMWEELTAFLLDDDLSGIEGDINLLHLDSVFLGVVSWDIEKGLDLEWGIS